MKAITHQDSSKHSHQRSKHKNLAMQCPQLCCTHSVANLTMCLLVVSLTATIVCSVCQRWRKMTKHCLPATRQNTASGVHKPEQHRRSCTLGPLFTPLLLMSAATIQNITPTYHYKLTTISLARTLLCGAAQAKCTKHCTSGGMLWQSFVICTYVYTHLYIEGLCNSQQVGRTMEAARRIEQWR